MPKPRSLFQDAAAGKGNRGFGASAGQRLWGLAAENRVAQADVETQVAVAVTFHQVPLRAASLLGPVVILHPNRQVAGQVEIDDGPVEGARWAVPVGANGFHAGATAVVVLVFSDADLHAVERALRLPGR